jgi:hypothetical protein
MPILWFEQHVQMSQEIANEVQMIIKLPSMGVFMGFVTIFIGVLQVSFIPLKNLITRQCCSQHSKINQFDKNDNLVADHPPEISPLIAATGQNGITLIGGGGDKNMLRS